VTARRLLKRAAFVAVLRSSLADFSILSVTASEVLFSGCLAAVFKGLLTRIPLHARPDRRTYPVLKGFLGEVSSLCQPTTSCFIIYLSNTV
jgi:hypothetical protein